MSSETLPPLLQAMSAQLDPAGVLAPNDAAIDQLGRLTREGLRSTGSAMTLRAQGVALDRYDWLTLTEAAAGRDVHRAVVRGAAAWTAQWAAGGAALLAVGAGEDGVAELAFACSPRGRELWRSDLAPDLLWDERVPDMLLRAEFGDESVLHPRPVTRMSHLPSSEAVPALTRLLALPLVDWTVVLRLDPVGREATAAAMAAVVRLQQEVGRRLSSTTAVTQTETSAVEDPQVRAVLDALEAWQLHLRACDDGGAWQVSAHCRATSAEDLAVVEAAASSLLGSASPGPEQTEQRWTRQQVDAAARWGAASGWLSAVDLGSLLVPPREALGAVQVRRPLPGGRRSDRPDRPLRLGRWLGTGVAAVLDVDDLAGHAFVAGITGSGKSTTTARLLTGLWNDHGIPFLVIDPAKADYEEVAPHLHGGLRVVSGEELAMNVLAPWPGAPVGRHISRVSSAFRGAFGLPVPVPYVAAMLFERLAEDAESAPVTLHDARARLDALIAELGYKGEIEDNIRASLGLRLRLLLQPRRADRVAGPAAPIWLTDRPTLVQLGDLGDDDERAFLAAMLVLYVADAARVRNDAGTVSHVTVVEEAHRLMPEPRGITAEEGDAGAVTARLMAQLLAEIRGYGEAVLVVDQSPAAVAREVIRNTATKLAHRIVDTDDQRVLGGALGLDEEEQSALGALGRGRCLVSTPALLRPQSAAVDRLLPAAASRSAMVGLPAIDDVCHRRADVVHHHASEQHGEDAELLVGLWAAATEPGLDPIAMVQRIVRRDASARSACLLAIGVRRYVAGLVRNGQLQGNTALAYGERLRMSAIAGDPPPAHPGAGSSGPLDGCEACPSPCRFRSLVDAGVVPGQRGLVGSAARTGSGAAAVEVLEDRMVDVQRAVAALVGPRSGDAAALCVALHAADELGLGVVRRFLAADAGLESADGGRS